jgi:uncharacterized UBP type Zn finger protein
MTTRIEQLEKENEELRNKLDIAVQRREYIEQKIFDSQYLTDTIQENAIKDIADTLDKEFIEAIKNVAKTNPSRVRGL